MWLVIDRKSKRPLGQADSLADALRGMKDARKAGYDADVRRVIIPQANPRIKFKERQPGGRGHLRKTIERDLSGPKDARKAGYDADVRRVIIPQANPRIKFKERQPGGRGHLRKTIERDLSGPIVMRRGRMLLPTHPDYKRLARKKNPRNCYAVIDYGAVVKSLGFRFTVQCLPDRPLQVPPGVQILVRGMTRQGARALADHLNGEVKRGRHVPRQPVVRLNPAFLRRGARGAFFQVRRSNPTLAVMGANPPRAAGDEIEATWAFLSYRRPDDPDGKRIVREHEFDDGFVATPLEDGSILLKHPRGSNLWTRR